MSLFDVPLRRRRVINDLGKLRKTQNYASSHRKCNEFGLKRTEWKLCQDIVKVESTHGMHDHRLEFNEGFVWFLDQYSHPVPLFIDN